MSGSFFLSLHEEAGGFTGGPGEWMVRGPRGTIFFQDLSLGTLEALARLQEHGADEDELAVSVCRTDGDDALPGFLAHLERLDEKGLLLRSVRAGGVVLATLSPLHAPFVFASQAVVAERCYLISRFAYTHREGSALSLESPRSRARIVLHDARAAALVGALAEPGTVAELVGRVVSLSAETVAMLLTLLLNGNMLAQEVDGDGMRSEDDNPALRTWSFHDLLFHTRSRLGRPDDPADRTRPTQDAAEHRSVEGLDQFDKVIDIDQSPIGRTPRSNPASYTGIFTPIRELFSGTQEARSRGYKPGRFSFNVKGGRCEACQGDGVIKVEMHFLPDVYVPCDVCKGKRYNRETLEVKYKGRSIHEVLDMTVEEGREFFDAIPALARRLQTLMDVGLSYIRLGQAATTLSGGEAQRVKLAKELSKRDTGKTLYILDEPTTGLHFYDIQQLLNVLSRLRDHGNSIVVIEHNLDVIKTADWVIDLGPEGGTGGGQIIATGTPEQVAACEGSHTGRFLKPLLEAQARLSAS
jgi:ABC-type Na+ transport system ATPase subunit NatA